MEKQASAPIALRIKEFRKSRGWNQSQLAEVCGITQSQVSRWEKDLDRPSPAALATIAQLVDDSERELWVADAGMSNLLLDGDPEVRRVPILIDAAAAGTPRAVDENNIEMSLPLPRRWLPNGGKLYGIRVVGDSMSPTVNDGYLVIVNVGERSSQQLVGRMVAARDGDGITVKWLRRDDGLFFLVPQVVSERHPIRVVQEEGNFSIVGEVVKIIGDPPTPKRK